MSWQATAWASKQECGGVGGKCLLYALANYADAAGRTWASQRRLMKDTEMSERSLRTWLQTLVDRGLLAITMRRRADGTRMPDLVVLCMAGVDPSYEAESEPPPDDQPATVAGCSTGNERTINRQPLPDQPANPAPPIDNNQGEQSGEPSKVEREGARAKPEADRDLAKFRRKWPTSAQDDQGKVERAWNGLSDDERKAALDHVEPFLEDAKRHKRTHTPTGWSYLEQRRWELLPETKTPSMITFKCWSKEWWGVLFIRADKRESIAFMVSHAASKDGAWGAPPNMMPNKAQLARLKGYPTDGREIQDWRPWFERRGAKLPDWREKQWVYLPGPEPPIEGQPSLPVTEPTT